MMSYLHTKFHDNWISSFRGVAITRFWDGRTDGQTDGRTDGQTDGQTDGVTALLDLLLPSATQVKISICPVLNFNKLRSFQCQIVFKILSMLKNTIYQNYILKIEFSSFTHYIHLNSTG